MINKSISEFNKNIHAKLRVLKSKNPKEYWNIINGASGSSVKLAQIKCEVFAKPFKSLNENHDGNTTVEFDKVSTTDNSPLNIPFDEEEIRKCVNKLKNNKSPGLDDIINEFIKCSNDKMCKLYCKFFNLVLSKGIVPEDWVVGVIKPIYKNKGSRLEADNYRGITLLSCMGKLFTFILNDRLRSFVEINGIMGEEQTGFRSGFSTMDHIFSLNFIIDFYLNRGKRLYAAFVDYRKAFDMVNRVILWQKLISIGVNGDILRIIHNLYDRAKSCVSYNGDLSEYFNSKVGVRQGENLSPLLFAIFLNDLVFFMSKKYNGLQDLSTMVTEELSDDTVETYLKLYTLLYADDTIILAESADQLQVALNTMDEYCNDN